jgi:predicted transcriptional regulator
MMTKIAIILLFTLAIFSAYQWGYQDAVGSEIESQILKALSERELYALDLLDTLNENRTRKIGFGIVYPTLNRLEQKKLIASFFEDSDRPKQKIYRLNPKVFLPEKQLDF